MLLLAPPYGWPNGVETRLLGCPSDDEEMRLTLLDYGCYPPAIPKIIGLLHISGRYDARLMDGVVRNCGWRMVESFRALGVTMEFPEGVPVGTRRGRGCETYREITNRQEIAA